MDANWKTRFAILWAGQFFSLVSSSAVNFAIIIWLSLQTGSAEVLAYAAIAGLLPQALIGPFAGVYVDRWDRKKTMILADSFVAACTLFMSISFYLGYENLKLVYVILGLRSIGSAFHMPAMQATIPLLAPQSELLRIAGINQIIKSFSNIAGPAIGALAIGLLSIGNVLLLDIVGAIIAVFSLLFISIPSISNEKKTRSSIFHVWQDMKSGYREVISNKGLSLLILYCAIAGFCIMPISVLLPLITIKHFQGGKLEMGIIETAWGLGALFGGGLLGVWKPSIRKVYLVSFAHVLIGIAFFWSGWLTPQYFVFFAVLTTLGGVSASLYNSGFTATVQETVKPALLGRVFSMYFSLDVLPTILALICTGFLVDNIGINIVFIIFGFIIFLVGVMSFLTPAFKNLN
ncbi:MFS transporter [Pedobacter antarcticus]|uniref:MFS transporter n=1 Tax=Pedobacter antarcticus TaxID=34086 RepID=UPI002931F483|nr:MFS transporter [Pedobacter antarcticus]